LYAEEIKIYLANHKLRKRLNWAEKLEAIFGHRSVFDLGIYLPFHVKIRSVDLIS
jgi:hypothetical protein